MPTDIINMKAYSIIRTWYDGKEYRHEWFGSKDKHGIWTDSLNKKLYTSFSLAHDIMTRRKKKEDDDKYTYSILDYNI